MTRDEQTIGCRATAAALAILIGSAFVLGVVGLALTNQDSCTGLCETAALTMLYAGGPVSAALGVFFGDFWVAWPLDITLWVVLAVVSARFAETRARSVSIVSITLVLIALTYGLVLSRFVEIAV